VLHGLGKELSRDTGTYLEWGIHFIQTSRIGLTLWTLRCL